MSQEYHTLEWTMYLKLEIKKMIEGTYSALNKLILIQFMMLYKLIIIVIMSEEIERETSQTK